LVSLLQKIYGKIDNSIHVSSWGGALFWMDWLDRKKLRCRTVCRPIHSQKG